MDYTNNKKKVYVVCIKTGYNAACIDSVNMKSTRRYPCKVRDKTDDVFVLMVKQVEQDLYIREAKISDIADPRTGR